MNDVVIPAGQARPHEGLRTLTHILYGLHTLSWFSAGMFSVIAMIVNYIKRPDLPDDFFRSHFRWQARSFWFTLLWLALTLPLWLFFRVPRLGGLVADWPVVPVSIPARLVGLHRKPRHAGLRTCPP
jgi:uncharacterized membrane protein